MVFLLEFGDVNLVWELFIVFVFIESKGVYYIDDYFGYCIYLV